MNPLHKNVSTRKIGLILFAFVAISLPGCVDNTEATQGISLEKLADVVYAILAADRMVYAHYAVTRMVYQEGLIKTSMDWKTDRSLPLPDQMFQMSDGILEKDNRRFRYSLISRQPINERNGPSTEVEKTGLRFVMENPEGRYFGVETIAGRQYYTAVYPDKAVTQACVTCHNEHKNPRKDFNRGDVLGAMVIRFLIKE